MIQGTNTVSGKITFQGKSLLNMPDSEFDKDIRWKEISMVFQGAMSSLDPVFTIGHQFDEILRQHKFKDKSNKVIHDVIPTTALDVLIQAQIINLLKQLKKKGLSIMLISHDLSILSEIVEKIGIMYGGRMVEFGTSSDIYRNPKHPYTKGLLDSIPRLHKEKELSFIPGAPPNLVSPKPGCRFFDRCPEAMEKCKKEPPKIKTDSGYVLCWLYE
jgi:peptide/nickel transport system ATP-binding protein